MYSDGDGNTIFALDDYLGWKPRQQASPSLTESIVSMASAVPFRMADEMVSALMAGVLSPMTVHRLLSGVGQSAMDDEYNRWESCFERGEDVCDGQQQADVLYTEAHGVWVHLQRETRKHYEVKSGIAYRGWRSVGDDRYELVDKRVYAHASEKIPFWVGAGIEWGKQYALEGVKLFVVGGDGANWIRSGTEEFGRALMSAAVPAETTTAIRDREYVESNLRGGVDWRNRVPNAPPDARSLGTMESNGDKLTANRMKKRGMSWTIRGAHCMAKVIQLNRNSELSKFCRSRRRCDRREPDDLPTHQRHEAVSKTRVSDWAEVSVPALSGPHSYRPWAHSLRNLIQPPLLLN